MSDFWLGFCVGWTSLLVIAGIVSEYKDAKYLRDTVKELKKENKEK